MFNAVEFFQDNDIPFWTYGKNVNIGWVNIKCPFCSDTSNHLGINPEGEYSSCWKCGWHSLDDLAYILFNRKNILLEYYSSSHRAGLKTKKATAKEIDLPGDFLKPIHIKYLKKRNYNPELLIEKYKIQGCFISPNEYKYRLIIPIILDSKIVSFQTRACFNTSMRYITCSMEKEIIHHKHLVYNTDNCIGETVILLEGVFDVWRLGNNTICGFGTEITKEQIIFISQRWKKVIILFDPEREALKKAYKCANELSILGVGTEVIEWDNKKDPGDLSEKDADELKKELLNI